MKLAGAQLVLDTNILLLLVRGQQLGQRLEQEYALSTRVPRCIVPIVAKGEILSLARKLKWGEAKVAALDSLLRSLLTADISPPSVLDAYALIDAYSDAKGKRMEKNDLWIAAIGKVANATVLTTDADFDHLNPLVVPIERVMVR